MAMPRLFARTSKRRPVVASFVLAFVLLYLWPSFARPQGVLIDEPIEVLTLDGFANTRIPDGTNCEDIRVTGQELAVGKSVYLDDDLVDVAKKASHPLIHYPQINLPKKLEASERIIYSEKLQESRFEKLVERMWGRMAGSSVWLEYYHVYLLVSRVFYYDRGVKQWSVISFLRAQVFDEHWNHLDGHQITWQGRTFTFPYTLDIPTPWEKGGVWFGPEDPRVIVDPHQPNPEPVVVFNMMVDTTNKSRAMHIHRPFSNYTTRLYARELKPQIVEKNWSPFFMPDDHSSYDVQRQMTSRYVHFLYDWNPFCILRCHLDSGECQIAYTQGESGTGSARYLETHHYPQVESDMHGGSNFVPVPLTTRPGFQSFVGFPRIRSVTRCGSTGLYRPSMMLLTGNGTHFYLDYASVALDFAHAFLTEVQHNNTCGQGRILLVNSIARFDTRPNYDRMTLTATVADSTVQSATLYGVRALLENLPQMQPHHSADWQEADISWKLNVTHDLRQCTELSASDYVLARVTPEEAARLEIERLKKEAGA